MDCQNYGQYLKKIINNNDEVRIEDLENWSLKFDRLGLKFKEYDAQSLNLKIKQSALENHVSLFKYKEKPFTIDEKSTLGSDLLSKGEPREALFAYNDAIFASLLETPGDVENLISLQMKQIECLLLDMQYRKAAIYSRHLLYYIIESNNGILNHQLIEKFALIMIWQGEAEIALGNYYDAIQESSKAVRLFCDGIPNEPQISKTIFNVRQTFFERLAEHLQDIEEPSPESNSSSSSDNQINIINGDDQEEEEIENTLKWRARIIVDPSISKPGVNSKHQFIVGDLDSALKISKDGDMIFLVNGTYIGAKTKKSGKSQLLEFRKRLTIVGNSSSFTILGGSIVKWGSGLLKFKNLKFEIGGVDGDSDDDIYLMNGTTDFEECVLESPVNTVLYVINNSDNEADETVVNFKNCILDGLQSARRFICFSGPKTVIRVDNSYILDSYSFITVIDDSQINSSGVLTIIDIVITQVQDGIKIIIPGSSSQFQVSLVGCQIELSLADMESPSHALSLTAGSISIYNNTIISNHLDSTCLSLHGLKSAEIRNNYMEIIGDNGPRGLALGQGIVLSENQTVNMSHLEGIGFRIGVHLSNQDEHIMNNVQLTKSQFQFCSLCIQISKMNVNSQTGCASSCSSSSTNLNLSLQSCHFKTCHYGLMSSNSQSIKQIFGNIFKDVAKPIMISKTNPLNKSLIEDNQFILSRDYLNFGAHLEESSSLPARPLDPNEALRNKMFLYFAVEENLPHRIAHESSDFILIWNKATQESFHDKYQSFNN